VSVDNNPAVDFGRSNSHIFSGLQPGSNVI